MKKRLDILLVEHGLASSREKARASIMCGDVYVDGQRRQSGNHGCRGANTRFVEIYVPM